MAVVSQGEATSMAQHVRMSACGSPSPFDHLGKSRCGELCATLGSIVIIVVPGSQISSKGRAADLGDAENACPLLLLIRSQAAVSGVIVSDE
jgi:hypothetical protein